MNVRILSSNIWGNYFGNEIAVREDQLLDVFRRYAPDVLGMQEATKSWRESALFRELCADYEFVDTGAFTEANYTPLAYRREFFDLVDGGFVSFEDTPDSSKSFTWAVLEYKGTGKRFGALSASVKINGGYNGLHRVSNDRLAVSAAVFLLSPAHFEQRTKTEVSRSARKALLANYGSSELGELALGHIAVCEEEVLSDYHTQNRVTKKLKSFVALCSAAFIFVCPGAVGKGSVKQLGVFKGVAYAMFQFHDVSLSNASYTKVRPPNHGRRTEFLFRKAAASP